MQDPSLRQVETDILLQQRFHQVVPKNEREAIHEYLCILPVFDELCQSASIQHQLAVVIKA